MVRSFEKFTKFSESKENLNSKKASFYDQSGKHGNEVSIILVITNENLNFNEFSKNKRKKSRERSCNCRDEAEYTDRLKIFNLSCSGNQSNQNMESYEKLKKIFKNLKQTKLKKFKKDEYQKEAVNSNQKIRKNSKEYNIYGPIRYIPTSYSRPSLPPFYKNKLLSQDPQYNDAYSNVLTKFLNSKYDFEHSTPSCSSDSEKSFTGEPLQRDDSFELKTIYSSTNKTFELNEKIQIGDRPDKNLEVKSKYFNVQQSNLNMSSQSFYGCESIEDLDGHIEGCHFPISRQNRVIFCESNNKNDDIFEYEANLPKLPDDCSILKITKRFEFNNYSNNLSRKYIGKKETGNRFKTLKQDQYNNLSDIAEEENLCSSSSSSNCPDQDKKENENWDNLNDMVEENSIQKDIDLTSESFSSTASSLKYSDDQIINDFSNPLHNYQYSGDNFYSDIRGKENFSFKKLYDNYFSLIDKKFTMSISRPEMDSKENLVFI